jgi:hypothetical protein
MESSGYSWPVPRRVCADSASTGLVQDTRELRGHSQDRSHGDDPYSERGQSHLGLVDDHAFATRVAPYYSRLFRSLSRLRRRLGSSVVLVLFKLAHEATTGHGIDRHFLGLRLMVRPETGRTSCVVDDPLFEGRSGLLLRLRWFGILRRRCTSAISCGRTLP